jgi:hypothetical protein
MSILRNKNKYRYKLDIKAITNQTGDFEFNITKKNLNTKDIHTNRHFFIDIYRKNEEESKINKKVNEIFKNNSIITLPNPQHATKNHTLSFKILSANWDKIIKKITSPSNGKFGIIEIKVKLNVTKLDPKTSQPIKSRDKVPSIFTNFGENCDYHKEYFKSLIAGIISSNKYNDLLIKIDPNTKKPRSKNIGELKADRQKTLTATEQKEYMRFKKQGYNVTIAEFKNIITNCKKLYGANNPFCIEATLDQLSTLRRRRRAAVLRKRRRVTFAADTKRKRRLGIVGGRRKKRTRKKRTRKKRKTRKKY